jgi:hypothetical protein
MQNQAISILSRIFPFIRALQVWKSMVQCEKGESLVIENRDMCFLEAASS